MERPKIFDYQDPAEFVSAMIRYRKEMVPGFTVLAACQGLHRCSPALLSNIMARKRRVTEDRVDAIAKVLGLSSRERYYFKEWIRGNSPTEAEPGTMNLPKENPHKRRRVSSFLLNDWIHPYVKDALGLNTVQGQPEKLYAILGGIASRARIDQSIKFLLKHGHVWRNLAGKLIVNDELAVLGDAEADRKIRRFHRQALEIAKQGLELYPVQERLAQALLLPLDDQRYHELLDLVQEFAEKLRTFAENNAEGGVRLYQLILHLTPSGGSHE
ncbi:MAG: TIGR02147 family protein [Proteobacteria bacterium]|nr:TIGR02147 family protein [Pseudomonadota bacterium]